MNADQGIAFPVFVIALDCDEITEYSSAAALAFLEAIDVDNAEYKAWDAEGQEVRLIAVGLTSWNPGMIRIERGEAKLGTEHLNQLKRRTKRRR